MNELISDTPDGPVVTRLEDMTDEQLMQLAVSGSQEAARLLAERGHGHQQ